MSRFDEAFRAITERARARAAESEAHRPATRGRTGTDRLGLDTPTGQPCQLCTTGWACVMLYDRDNTDGRPACARCAEKRRMRAATYGLDGPVVYMPLESAEGSSHE